MKHEEGFFKGVRGAKIYFQSWLPESEPRAVLLIVHGLAEHSGRYRNVVNHFIPLGYAICGIDHLGHGKSEGRRVYVERFDDYTDTLKVYCDMIQGWHPRKPTFLVGHSMGGLISAVYLLDHQADLAGAAAEGSRKYSPGGRLLSRACRRILEESGRDLSSLVHRARILSPDGSRQALETHQRMGAGGGPLEELDLSRARSMKCEKTATG